jgi:tetratricopeptide (TPR) repeat protein
MRNNQKAVADFSQSAGSLQRNHRPKVQVTSPAYPAAAGRGTAPPRGTADVVFEVQSILTNGARSFLGLERLDLATALSDLSLSENDRDADALSVAAHILDRQGEWEKSIAFLRQAYESAPEAPQVCLNLAMALLRFGDFREGFALYEARVDKKTWSGFATGESRAAMRHLRLRPDQPIEDKRIVVLAEQGLGDCIMFARYIVMLVDRGARVLVVCNPTLRPFFERIAGIETVLSPPSDKPSAQINLTALPFDAWIPLLSLPGWFGINASNVPGRISYWTPDQSIVVKWRDRFAASGRFEAPKVGLVFQANPVGASFAEKSMTIDDVMPLLSLEEIDFVNLQHGPAGRALQKAAPRLIDPFPIPVPLDEYAAAIAATDLVISVDTMAAHCAGAMGQRTWLAAPRSPHWAWGLDGAATSWYSSLRIFRQAKRRSWSCTINTLSTQLTKEFGLSTNDMGADERHTAYAGAGL